jgi:hypothetical protein
MEIVSGRTGNKMLAFTAKPGQVYMAKYEDQIQIAGQSTPN